MPAFPAGLAGLAANHWPPKKPWLMIGKARVALGTEMTIGTRIGRVPAGGLLPLESCVSQDTTRSRRQVGQGAWLLGAVPRVQVGRVDRALHAVDSWVILGERWDHGSWAALATLSDASLGRQHQNKVNKRGTGVASHKPGAEAKAEASLNVQIPATALRTRSAPVAIGSPREDHPGLKHKPGNRARDIRDAEGDSNARSVLNQLTGGRATKCAGLDATGVIIIISPAESQLSRSTVRFQRLAVFGVGGGGLGTHTHGHKIACVTYGAQSLPSPSLQYNKVDTWSTQALMALQKPAGPDWESSPTTPIRVSNEVSRGLVPSAGMTRATGLGGENESRGPRDALPACEDTVSPRRVSRPRGDVDQDKDRWRLAFASKTGGCCKPEEAEENTRIRRDKGAKMRDARRESIRRPLLSSRQLMRLS
ncbi:hypothetical protein NPX13_g7585 [Xylaria arbuscula]|uniref:Uncharacterized protein n=1 Tax=Xylaria arbuscula TaxID=114810 RepID=A0A9W8NAE5_9PEZI|nr:hypothetical protein NPX13_g7585 [Xylaria arbuscula]